MLILAWFNLVEVNRSTDKQFIEEMCANDTNVQFWVVYSLGNGHLFWQVK